MTVALQPPAQLGGLKKVLRKAAAPVAAAAAVLTGNPELAVAAYQGTKSITRGKSQPVEPPAPAVPVSFLDRLAPADRNVLLIGGTVIGTLILARLVGRRGR